MLITFQQDKFAVPFGAMVSVDGSENPDVGIVNENGEVYLSGLPERGSITAKWGLNNEMKCHADFVLPASTGKNKRKDIGLQQINVICK
ncbi:FimD/PapC C-terminal domain-containing protein [Enterobacter vonholyi]